MARAKTVWGIDIGQCALKAVKVRLVDGQLQTEALNIIEHAKILSEPDADRSQLIEDALRQFLASADIRGSHVVISVPGQSTFSRFVKLPPVEAKRVPDIVRFEAEQQIPFPINEVIWRWQTFRDPDSPDVEVGIFAMKRADVAEMLSHFAAVDLSVDTVQMAPLALYNFMLHDEQLADDGATLLADVGADKTDLVVADKGRIWTRTIQIGGNNFTEALVRTFKLSFDKAEKRKRGAASDKYARQIFQAMRPVFADLVQEMQRSIGFYTSLHRETRFKRLIGLGNGFRLPGLQKFIEQNLNIPVARIDSYNKLLPSASVNAPALNENVLSLAVAYGLAVQGLGLAAVSTNLLPGEIVRKRLWDRKRTWFAAAAIVLLAAMFCPGYRARQDSVTLENRTKLAAALKTSQELERRIGEWQQVSQEGNKDEKKIQDLANLFGYRCFWPAVQTMVNRSIALVAPDQALLVDYGRYLEFTELDPRTSKGILTGKSDGTPLNEQDLRAAAGVLMDGQDQIDLNRRLAGTGAKALAALTKSLITETGDSLDPNTLATLGDPELKLQARRLLLAQRMKRMVAFKKTERSKRRTLVIEKLSGTYHTNLAAATAGEGDLKPSLPPEAVNKPGVVLELIARTSLPLAETNKMAADLRLQVASRARWLSFLNVRYHAVQLLHTGAVHDAAAAGAAPAAPPGPPPPGPGPAVKGPVAADPFLPDEDMVGDTRFRVVWWIEVVGDGIVLADVKLNSRYELAKAGDLMPEFDPKDAVAASKTTKDAQGKEVDPVGSLKVGMVVLVDAVQKKWSTSWYHVRVMDATGKQFAGPAGWVSGECLVNGTEVKEPAP